VSHLTVNTTFRVASMSDLSSRSRSRSHSESECVDRESLLVSDLPRVLIDGCSSDVLVLKSLEKNVLQNTLTPLAAMQRNESMEKSGLLHYMGAAYYSPQRVAQSAGQSSKRDVSELAMALLRRWCAPLMALDAELWKNMLLCGGLVCRALLAALHGREQPTTWPSPSDALSLLPEGTDADVFFYGLTGAAVRAKLAALRAALKPDMVTHTRRTVTFYQCVHVGEFDAVSKIQFMLMSSESAQEVLDNFDVDASGFGVTVAPGGCGGERSALLEIIGTRRALTSLYTRTVQVRMSKSTFRYAHRLNKYREMGFNIVSSRSHFQLLPQSAVAQKARCSASCARVGIARAGAAGTSAATPSAASSSRESERGAEDSESGYNFAISRAISPGEYDHVRALLGFFNAPRSSYWQASPQIVSRMYVSAAHKMILPCAQLHKIEVKRGTTMPPRDGDTAEAAASSSEVTGPSPAAQSASDSRGNWFYLDVRPVLNRFDDDRLRSIVREVVQKNTLTLSAARAAFTTEELAAAGDTEALAASVMRRVKEYMVCVDHALRDPDKGACRVLGTRRELYGPRGTPESIEHMLRKTRFRMYARPQLRRYVRIVQA